MTGMHFPGSVPSFCFPVYTQLAKTLCLTTLIMRKEAYKPFLFTVPSATQMFIHQAYRHSIGLSLNIAYLITA